MKYKKRIMKKTLIFTLLFLSILTINAQRKILFDNTKSEEAGNADWIIDTSEPIPTPAQSGVTSSTLETYWKGGISAWGIEMVKKGFYVETLPYSNGITYGSSSNSMDLSNYDVFVVCEPNNPFTASEKTAIMNFVKNGGGLFMVADHEGADRDNDGWDAYAAWNDLITNNSVQNNAFGMIFSDDSYINDYPCNNIPNLPGDPLLHGNAGNVTGMEFHGSAAMSINTSNNPTVKGVVFNSGYSNTGTSHVMVAYSQYGQGKVVGLVDSSPADDGSGQSGNTLYEGWNELDNGVLITNATLWLAEETVNIENENNENGINIYPNPSNGKFNIVLSKSVNNANISISDMTGKVILVKDMTSSYKQIVDLSSYSKGIYFIKFNINNKTLISKLILK